MIGVVGDGVALVETASNLNPGVIVTDISMPGLSGIGAARQLKSAGAGSEIILFTMHIDVGIAAEALRKVALSRRDSPPK